MTDSIDVTAIQRVSMLRMGKTWQQMGKLNQAIDIYLRIVRENSGTTEAEEAKAALVKIAADFEIEGRYHLAMDIFDHLRETAI